MESIVKGDNFDSYFIDYNNNNDKYNIIKKNYQFIETTNIFC